MDVLLAPDTTVPLEKPEAGAGAMVSAPSNPAAYVSCVVTTAVAGSAAMVNRGVPTSAQALSAGHEFTVNVAVADEVTPVPTTVTVAVFEPAPAANNPAQE